MITKNLFKTLKTDGDIPIFLTIIPMVCLVLVMIITGCSVTSRPSKPNILLLTLDTTRQDHIGAWGNPWINTPNLDRFAQHSYQFLNCVSTSNSTNPSHSSMLTSLHCNKHRIYDNHHGLPESLIQFPEILTANQYDTSAFVSAIHLNDDVSSFGKGITDFYPCHGNFQIASDTIGKYLNHLNQKQSQEHPFFTWVHLFDPHMLYNPPDIFKKFYYQGNPYTHEPDTAADIIIAPDLKEWVNDWKGEVKDLFYLQRLYSAEVSYLDMWLGKLFNRLKQDGQWDNTIVFITADHGESLGEHGVFFNHYTLYHDNIHIPFMFKTTGEEPGSHLSDQPVSTVDIAPTLFQLCNIEIPSEFEGIPLNDISSPEVDLYDRTLICEEAHHEGLALVHGDFKFYDDYRTKQTFLLNLEKDPAEKINVKEVFPQVFEDFKNNNDLVRKPGSEAEPTSEPEIMKPVNKNISEQLRALGYVE